VLETILRWAGNGLAIQVSLLPLPSQGAVLGGQEVGRISSQHLRHRASEQPRRGLVALGDPIGGNRDDPVHGQLDQAAVLPLGLAEGLFGGLALRDVAGHGLEGGPAFPCDAGAVGLHPGHRAVGVGHAVLSDAHHGLAGQKACRTLAGPQGVLRDQQVRDVLAQELLRRAAVNAGIGLVAEDDALVGDDGDAVNGPVEEVAVLLL
jgi:hypothetical protein